MDYLKLNVKIVIKIIIKMINIIIPRTDLILIGSHFGYFGECAAYQRFLNKLGCNVIYVVRKEFEPQVNTIGIKYTVKYSFSWFVCVLKARYFVISHVVNDIFFVKPHGVKCINVWHGEPLKYIGYCSKVENEWLKYKKYTDYQDWDLFIAHNERYAEKIHKATKINKNKINIIGSLLLDSIHELMNEKYSSQKRVLYLPTFRENKNLDLKSVSKAMSRKFSTQNILFNVKFHPKESVQVLENFMLDKNFILYESLHNYDLVITDYSSVIFDCLNLNIPVCLFIPDFDDYILSVGGLFDDIGSLDVLKVETHLDDLLNYIIIYLSNVHEGFKNERKSVQHSLVRDIFCE